MSKPPRRIVTPRRLNHDATAAQQAAAELRQAEAARASEGALGAAQGGVAWRMTVRLPTVDLPAQVGPCRLEAFGAKWVAVRCPDELKPLMRQWEPGTRRWLIERRRLGSLVRKLRLVTDTLFRRAGLDLDGN